MEAYENLDNLEIGFCEKTNDCFTYRESDTRWDESGYAGSYKLVRCPLCGKEHILRYLEDRWIDEGKEEYGKR